MRKIIPFVLGFLVSFSIIRVALGDTGSGSGASGSAITAVAPDAGVSSAVAIGSGAEAGSAVASTGSGSGSAATLPDPIQDPGASLSLVEKLYKSGTLFAAGILAVFFLLGALEAKVTWLQQGYRKLVVTSLLGGLGVLSIPAAAGTTPNAAMVLAAVLAAIGIAVKGVGSASS